MKISRIVFTIFYLVLLTFYPKTLISADVTLRDIERHCEVYKYSASYGHIGCDRPRLRSVERKCRAYIYNFPYGDVECRGRDLLKVEKKCEIVMYSQRYGDFIC